MRWDYLTILKLQWCNRWSLGMDKLLYPPLQRSWKGVYWFHLVRLSVCGQNRVRSVSSTILIGSISYLHILSSNFRRCVVCNVCFKIQKFWRILEICNFDLVFFWLGIQYDSMVWVIMRRRGYPQNAGVLVVLVSSHTLLGMWLLIHAGIKVKPC